MEATKKVDFTIGAAGGDTTAPVTTSALTPATPGAGGTYNGPVSVQLSATDPAQAGGGGAPKTVDVNAAPDHWEPNAVTPTVGDTVRWNFPAATAGTVHDVWLIKPSEAPTSDGTELSRASSSRAAPPVTSRGRHGRDLHVHTARSTRTRARTAGKGWSARSPSPRAAAPTPGSGVDYTEYRVNTGGATGEWVRKDNTSSASPFVTTVQVAAAGSHVVEYRSKDKAGNTEATKSVAFSIATAATSVDSEDADVIADVPLMMALALGGTATFAPADPRAWRRTTPASPAAKATSSAPSTVADGRSDRSATATGHLVNGTAALPQALQVGAGGPFAPIGGDAHVAEGPGPSRSPTSR